MYSLSFYLWEANRWQRKADTRAPSSGSSPAHITRISELDLSIRRNWRHSPQSRNSEPTLLYSMEITALYQLFTAEEIQDICRIKELFLYKMFNPMCTALSDQLPQCFQHGDVLQPPWLPSSGTAGHCRRTQHSCRAQAWEHHRSDPVFFP